MLGPHIVHSGSYKAKVALPTKFVIVVLDAGAGECKLPTTAADLEGHIGIAQSTADIGDMVEVAELGSSFLKCQGAIALGARVTGHTATAGKEGWGMSHPKPATPAAPGGAYVQAEVAAILTYVDDMQNFNERTVAKAEQAAAADGDLIVVSLMREGKS